VNNGLYIEARRSADDKIHERLGYGAAGVFPRSADWRRAACHIHRLYLGKSSPVCQLTAAKGNPEVTLPTCGRDLSAMISAGRTSTP